MPLTLPSLPLPPPPLSLYLSLSLSLENDDKSSGMVARQHDKVFIVSLDLLGGVGT